MQLSSKKYFSTFDFKDKQSLKGTYFIKYSLYNSLYALRRFGGLKNNIKKVTSNLDELKRKHKGLKHINKMLALLINLTQAHD